MSYTQTIKLKDMFAFKFSLTPHVTVFVYIKLACAFYLAKKSTASDYLHLFMCVCICENNVIISLVISLIGMGKQEHFCLQCLYCGFEKRTKCFYDERKHLKHRKMKVS